MAGASIPVLVGAAQLVQRDVAPAEALSPLAMLEQVARGAAADAGAGDRALADADSIAVIDVAAWGCQNAARLLAERIGASPAREYGTGIGGEAPLVAVNHIANEIATGASRVAVIAGCNNLKTLRAAHKQGIDLGWEAGGEGEPTLFATRKMGSSGIELHYGLNSPPTVYPIFENALRAHRGLDLESHRKLLGALMSGFTEVASKNPYAWFPLARSADEISKPSPSNRMVAFPYTKYMNAILDTDQAAGVLMMSAEAARAYGIPEDRWVHWWGGAHSEERAWYPSQRPSFADCAALRAAAEAALDGAGLGIDAIDLFDFYSCFPVAVEMACEMLGLDESDPRGLTLTGGLPYGGGPGSNYTLHSLATAVDRLRDGSGDTALVTGNGWYLTKHSATVLATAPREGSLPTAGPVALPDEPDPVEIAEAGEGDATVETYTVVYGRDGAPERGIVIGRLDAGDRFIANTPEDRALLEQFASAENVGRRGRVRHRDGRNCFEPA
jgi:acetyl-CoA C-acetyltransferase